MFPLCLQPVLTPEECSLWDATDLGLSWLKLLLPVGEDCPGTWRWEGREVLFSALKPRKHLWSVNCLSYTPLPPITTALCVAPDLQEPVKEAFPGGVTAKAEIRLSQHTKRAVAWVPHRHAQYWSQNFKAGVCLPPQRVQQQCPTL